MSENRRGGFFYSHCREHSCYAFKIQKRDFYIFWSDMSKNRKRYPSFRAMTLLTLEHTHQIIRW